MRSWRETVEPVPMERIAVVAAGGTLHDVLARVAAAGSVQLDAPRAEPGDGAPGRPAGAGNAGRAAIDAQIDARARQAVVRGDVAALAGWTPAEAVPALSARLAGTGGGVVVLPRPPGAEPPTLLRTGRAGASLRPLVETYGTVPYQDIDPTPVAAAAYLLMFGMMFGDVGHGLLLLAVAAALAWWHRLARVRRAWPFALGAGLSGMAFGLAYGEFFGPTGVVPVLWLRPLEHPVPLLVAAVAVGAALLAGAFTLGTVNRLREGGWASALYAPTGLAGAALLAGLGMVAGGWYAHVPWAAMAGGTVALLGAVLAFAGFAGAGGGPAQAALEVFDTVLGLGSNVASFTRLAAFGLMHAALGMVVWDGTRALWARGPGGIAGGAALFAAGNLLAFTLEAVVVAIQALRLEYYELFSRVFQFPGRPFRPWSLPIADEEVRECRHGSSAFR